MKRSSGGEGWTPRKKGGGSKDSGFKDGRAGGHPGGAGSGVPRTRHAFKILCTDEMAAGLLGSRGARKDEIQEDTGARLVFSNRGDYFPETYYRVLSVYADDVTSIMRVFDWVLRDIVTLGDEEQAHPSSAGPEFLGKEPGEYIFRLCVTRRMSSQIIGTHGSNIKKIRDDTGAKAFIDNETYLGHRFVRVIGLPEQIISCLEQINEFVQADCEEDLFFTAFASLVNFGEAMASGWKPPQEWDGPPSHSEKSGSGGGGAERRGKGSSKRGGKGSKASGKGSGKNRGKGNREGAGPAAAAGSGEDASAEGEDASQLVDGLADIIGDFPGNSAQLQYSITFQLPAESLPVLEADEYFRHVEESTQTAIDFERVDEPGDESQPLTIVGVLLGIYTAHAMLLQKLQAAAAAERERAEREAEEEAAAAAADAEDPAVLKLKIAELEAQLAKATKTAKAL